MKSHPYARRMIRVRDGHPFGGAARSDGTGPAKGRPSCFAVVRSGPWQPITRRESSSNGGAKRPPYRGAVSQSDPSLVRATHALPAIEFVGSCAFTPPDGESNNPKDQQDNRRNPQQVDGEPCSEKNQDKK
jgi:hypothetical protein